MNKELLSVIIPVYNVSDYLPKCIKSVMQQTYSSLEIILIDDGSTDDSGEICDKYKLLDDRIMVIHKQNGGLSSARNAGLEASTGELIAFLDSDDWINETMYEELIDCMHNYNAEVASCGFKEVYTSKEIIRSNTGLIKIYNRNEAIRGLLKQEEIRFEVWNKVFKRTLIGEVRFKDKQIFEDIYFERCIFMKMNQLVYIDKPMHNYLMERPGNTTSKFTLEKMCAFSELEEFYQELVDHNMTDAAECIQAMSVHFTMQLYLQAKKLKVEKAIQLELKRIYKTYYKQSLPNQYVSRKRTFLFNISPTVYAFVVRRRS